MCAKAEPRRICFVSAYFPPHMGGVENFTYYLSTALSKLGCSITVLTCNYSSLPDMEQISDSITVHRIPSRDIGKRFPAIRKCSKTDEILSKINGMHFDSVIVNQRFYPLCTIGMKIAQDQGLRPIVIEHGSSYLTIGNKAADLIIRRYEKAVTKRALQYQPVFYGVSLRAAESLRERFGISPAGVIHNSIDGEAFRKEASDRSFRSEFGIPEQSAIVAFTGRLVREKGIWKLHEACRLLSNEANAPHFILAGEGPEEAGLRKEFLPNLHLTGRLARNDVSALLKEADIFCLPSDSEGLATSLLEAAVSDAYIVTSDVGGARDVIPDDHCGTILDKPSPDDLARAIKECSKELDATKQRAAACRRHVEENLSWEAAARQVLAICDA